jgi:hypothetical protein
MNSRLEAILTERGKGSVAQWIESQSIIETVNDGDNSYCKKPTSCNKETTFDMFRGLGRFVV